MDKVQVAPKKHRSICTIRIWMMVTALLFFILFFLSNVAMSKVRAKNNILQACISNSPAHPSWAHDLESRGIPFSKRDEVAKSYCLCMWQEALESMSQEEIIAFSKMNIEAQVEKQGGIAALETRNQHCWQQQKVLFGAKP